MKNIYFCFIILLLFCGSLFAQESLRKVSLQLPWLHQFQFAGYYIAKEKGYYKEYGLDVSFKEMNNNVHLTQDVLNDISTYSIGRSSIILDKIKGDDIVALLAVFQNSPLILLTLKESGFTAMADLKHKNIMLTHDAIGTVAIHAMLVSNGVDLKELTFQNHTYNINDLIQKKTDAVGAYISNEPYALEIQEIPYTIFNPKDYGFNFYDGILFTSNKELKNNPIDVYHFYKASLKGWHYAFENVSETINLIHSKYNTQNKTLDALLYEAYVLKELALNAGVPLGTLEEEKVQEIAKIYSILGFSKNLKMNLTDFIYNNKLLLFSAQEKQFLQKETVTYFTENFEPFYLYDKDFVRGIAIDIWEQLRKNIQLTSHYATILNPNAIEEKLTQTKHAIKLQLSYNTTSNEDMIFSNTIKSYPYAIATRNNEEFIGSMTQLNNKTVLLVKNTLIAQKIKNQHPKINLIEVQNSKMALDLLSSGKAFAFIDILPTLTHYIKSGYFSNLKISGTTPFKYDLRYMAHKQEKELIGLLNKAIESLDEQSLNQIEEKYFKILYASHTDYSLLYKLGVPLLICLLIFGFYNFRLKQEIEKRKITEQKLYTAATIDTLTQINNRSQIDIILQEQLISTKRYKTPVSIIFFDIDGFKQINDTYGHNLADTVLIDLAQLTKNSIRATDQVGRWGGEEFLIVLTQTNLEQAATAAVHLKDRIENFKFQINQTVTCSFGVTQLEDNDTPNSALTRVDNLMYYVKKHGKNGVKVG
jgi:polar amino acid transport system substrate-binding protein